MNTNNPGAIFHLSCRVHSRSVGANAVRIAAYVSGTRMTSKITGRTYNYTRKKEVTHTEIVLPPFARPDFYNRSKLFNAADLKERRKDAQILREVTVALPHSLNESQRLHLMRTWINVTFINHRMGVDFAIHEKPGNFHGHVLILMRELTTDGFGKKVREWNNPRLLEVWRESWAAHVNAALEAAGFDIRIDHRSYKRQGLNIKPTRHLGKRYSDNKEVYEERLEYNADVISNRASAPLPPKSGLPAVTPGKCPSAKKNKPKINLTPSPGVDQIFSTTTDTPSIS